MHRYSRIEFLAFGLLPALNVVALLVRGLYISTSGNYGEGKTIPILVILVALILLASMVAAIKRGYDLDISAKLSVPVLVVSAGAIVPLPLLYLALCLISAKPDSTAANTFGPPPRQMNIGRWLWGFVLLIAPWVALFLLARIL
ncbi:MAG TPA: DUF805 domain-containing protein [Burkholderiales bacterium]|nr:DUF805 domain-containing protein [Burkholderiales bacterium]